MAVESPRGDTRELTVRAVITGMVIGGVLSLCNVYTGLKIGWSFNMSITAALLSYGFWQGLHATAGTRRWGKLENNINQTAASSAAAISSAGLVAPIPALTLLTGVEFGWAELALWTFSVAMVGVVVAVSLRRQMLEVDALPFPFGVAAGEALNEMYARGSEAAERVRALLLGGLFGGAMNLWIALAKVPKLILPGVVSGFSLKNLTFVLSPSPLFVALGALVGLRTGLSMLFGAFVAWAVVVPLAIRSGWVMVGAPDAMWFRELVEWALWPGVAMMVTAALTSFSFSWRSVLAAMRGLRTSRQQRPRRGFAIGVMAVLLLSVVLQFGLFGIGWGLATFGVLLTFVLAIVAARVSGETGLTPIGAMGKVTQLTFGALDGSNVSANLMAANVTGGAASQCADLLHDLKAGLMVGASPRSQAIAQCFGVLSGALCGSAVYLVLAQDLDALLADPDWGLTAVLQWKAVAEIFQKGIENLPVGSVPAMLWGGTVGVVLAVLEKVLRPERARWVPSPTAIGLAFVIPAYYSISMAAGALLSEGLRRRWPTWTRRFLIVVAAGVVAGDSLMGVGVAVVRILSG